MPIIYLTSFLDKETVKKALKTGPSSYLIKPLDINELRINMELALEKYKEKDNDNQEESNKCKDIYKFISSIVPPLTSNIPIYKRNQFLIEFSKKFEKDYSFDFQNHLKYDLKTIKNNEEDNELIRNSYLSHLVRLLKNMGFNFQESEKYILSSHCPWKIDESHNNFLCLICQLIIKNTMEWANIEGVVEPKSSISNGYQNCIFEFKFHENK
ncbi:MAG: methanogen output domain 1-containing protein [Methanobacteriaceae archaeon]|nr:methanogen output domain 1-containing protein [Methanobacteriaceae archaeon]